VNAAWISHSWGKDAHPLGGYPVAFRKDFSLERIPAQGKLHITASPHYLLWINGRFVDEGPARCFPQRQILDELDVTAFLRKGTNSLAVLLPKPSGVTGYSLVHRMGLLVEGLVTSDTTWYTRQADWFTRTPWLFTFPLGAQEHFDANKEPAGWQTLPLDDTWKPVFCLGGPGTPPWKTLVPSLTRKNVRRPVQPRLIWRGQTSREVADVRLVNLAAAFQTQEASFTTPSQDENLFVYDFGKTCFVSIGLQVSRWSAGQRLELYYDITWKGTPSASRGFGHEEEGCCDSFTPGPDVAKAPASWRSLAPRGLRYLTVKVVGEGACDFLLDSLLVEYPFGDRPSPVAHDPFLSRLWEISRATLLSSTTDEIGEPARENVLWTLDACVGGKAAWQTFGDTSMWKHCLALIADGIDADGVPHAVVPAGDSFMMLFDQTLYWVVSCREYGDMTGDQDFVRTLEPAIERFLGLCARHITPDGFFIPPDYSWHWVDWAKLEKRPYSLPVNALLLLAARSTKVPSAANLVQTLQTSLLQFWDEKEQAFRSRIAHEQTGPLNSINVMHPMETTYEVQFDLHSNALAWWAELGTKDQRRGGVLKMLALFEAAKDGTLGYGPLLGNGWTAMILTPVFQAGFREQGMELVRRYYQPWIDLNAQTWGEDFTPALHNTAHGWGACINSLIVEAILKE